ncbi:CcoQ/FixQ family Cbb3-type cytochrome c oxidase assembly chaperone [Chitinophaga sp. Hz27]|uniref:CcoQ/FixQ family Cbb3-type cytochrome c oxidase assembly chaperone n=1 Tax=Chitinophaga sp. Hz27 TaxID=3347169 RepID=UPI0035DC0D25
MKFINYLQSISGISIYPLITLVLFVLFFIGAAYLAFSADKRMMEHVSRIPLDKEEN